MNERKPLFPEYIWMFFVGLLLAIIICMRLIPGHADYIVADNPYNDNIIFITLEGRKIHFTSFMGNEIYSTINPNNNDWSEALESDIVSYAYYAKLFFGEGNFSVVVVDNYSVAYYYNRLIQLIGPIVGTIYSSYYSGPSEDFLVLNNPWASLSENTFSEYYPTLSTLNLDGYLMPYYKLDPNSLPTPTASPTPTPELDNRYCYFYSDSGDSYFLLDIYGYDLCSSFEVDTSNPMVSSVLSWFPDLGTNIVNSVFLCGSTTRQLNTVVYLTASEITSAKLYYIGSVAPSRSVEFYRENFVYVTDAYCHSCFDNFYAVSKGQSTNNYSGSSFFFSPGNFDDLVLISDGMTSNPPYMDGIFNDILFYDYYYTDSHGNAAAVPLYWGIRLGLDSSSSPVEPSPSPTPDGWVPTVTPTITPTPATVIIQYPSGSPSPTPPVTLSGSDLPGGASGEGGSISGAGGMNASEAESIYQYWTNKITNNQALAFLVSFFGLLPFDLVYALGTIIFILILLSMVRLFIHFIS